MSLCDDQSRFSGLVRSTAASDDGPPHSAIAHQRQAKALVAALELPEITMLQQIVAGWSRVESAGHMNIELYQFDERRVRLFEKLHAISTTDAVRIGIYAGLD